MSENLNKTRNSGYKYRVEECDCYSSHLDHDDVALVNDSDIAILIANTMQQKAKHYQEYVVFDEEEKRFYSAKYGK